MLFIHFYNLFKPQNCLTAMSVCYVSNASWNWCLRASLYSLDDSRLNPRTPLRVCVEWHLVSAVKLLHFARYWISFRSGCSTHQNTRPLVFAVLDSAECSWLAGELLVTASVSFCAFGWVCPLCAATTDSCSVSHRADIDFYHWPPRLLIRILRTSLKSPSISFSPALP